MNIGVKDSDMGLCTQQELREELCKELREPENKSIVYFDGSCPICSREIASMECVSNEELSFIDVHSIDGKLEKNKTTLLKDLHVRTNDGAWLVGLDANIYMWERAKTDENKTVRKFRLLAKILKLPLVHWVASVAYRLWANRRYAHLYGNS